MFLKKHSIKLRTTMELELKLTVRIFFMYVCIFIAKAFIAVGFKKSTIAFKVADVSRKNKIVLWYFFYPVIR